MIDSKTYKVGIYLRLSREDLKDGESASITNQRDLLLNYIRDHDLIFVDEYVDDGVSGTTFDRENFNRMIEDIDKKKINMVITKDLSRLGRDHIDFGYYVERYFPEKQVRFIALGDGIDTGSSTSNNKMLLFKAMYNDMYVQDISDKIKATIYNKRRNGKFLGSVAPYGYNKDPQDKHKLIIDEKSAEVVKRIFNMFASGIGLHEICKTLTNEKIPIPSVYKNLNRGLKSTAYGIWQTRTVSDILKCPTYIGNLTQGRLRKVSYKSPKIIRPKKSEWIICENSCPAIIDKETFEIVQNIYERNKNQGKNSQDILLKGFVFCKECGHTIGFRLHKTETKSKGKFNRCYGNCNYWSKYKTYNLCTPHNINYYELEDGILNEIRTMCKRYLKTNNFEDLLKNNDKVTRVQKELETRLTKLKNEIELSTKKIDEIYNDKLNGLIDMEMYKRIYNQITESTIEKKNEIINIEKKIYNLKNNIISTSGKYDDIIKEYLSMKRPSVQLLSNIIDRIVIDEDKNIDIYYKFKPFENGY